MAPSCALTATGTLNGHKYLQITVQDQETGLATVTITTLTNMTAQVAAYSDPITFAPSRVTITDHTTRSVVVTATKLDQNLGSQVAMQVQDVAGNVTTCDPIDLTLDRTTGRRTVRSLPNVSASEHYLLITNGSPGVTTLTITVNGHHTQLAGLSDGEVRELDMAAWLHAGQDNVVEIRTEGAPGGSAWALLAEQPPPLPTQPTP